MVELTIIALLVLIAVTALVVTLWLHFKEYRSGENNEVSDEVFNDFYTLIEEKDYD